MSLSALNPCKCPKCGSFPGNSGAIGPRGCSMKCGNVVVLPGKIVCIVRDRGVLDYGTCGLQTGGVCWNANCICYNNDLYPIELGDNVLIDWTNGNQIPLPQLNARTTANVGGVHCELFWRTLVTGDMDDDGHIASLALIVRPTIVCGTGSVMRADDTACSGRSAADGACREFGCRRCGVDGALCSLSLRQLSDDSLVQVLTFYRADRTTVEFPYDPNSAINEITVDGVTYTVVTVNDGLQDGNPLRFIACVPKKA